MWSSRRSPTPKSAQSHFALVIFSLCSSHANIVNTSISKHLLFKTSIQHVYHLEGSLPFPSVLTCWWHSLCALPVNVTAKSDSQNIPERSNRNFQWNPRCGSNSSLKSSGNCWAQVQDLDRRVPEASPRFPKRQISCNSSSCPGP